MTTSTDKNSLTLKKWLEMPLDEIKSYITSQYQKPLTVMISIDGTRRYYLKEKYKLVSMSDNNELKKLAEDDKGRLKIDFYDYAAFITKPLSNLFDLLFSAGITNVLNLSLIPPNFERPGNYLNQAIGEIERVFLHSKEFKSLYQKHQAQLRLFGDYDVAPQASKVREQLQQLTNKCLAMDNEYQFQSENSSNNNSQISSQHPTLCLGVYAGTYTQEIALRTTTFFNQQGRLPSDEELIRASFPPQLSAKVDILISAGWLKVGGILPPLLDGGVTDIYNLSFLALDLDELTLKHILYDHLFMRNVVSEDNLSYTYQNVSELAKYYDTHQKGLIGIGQLVGPNLWYALYPELPTK